MMGRNSSWLRTSLPMSSESLVPEYPLSIPALAEVIGIIISNFLFFITPPSSPQLPYLFHVPFISHYPPFPLSFSCRLSALGRMQRLLPKLHLLACSCTSISILKDICNLKNCSLWAPWQLLHHPSEVEGPLNYRAWRFCWTSATREGNTHLGQVTTSGMRIHIKSFTSNCWMTLMEHITLTVTTCWSWQTLCIFGDTEMDIKAKCQTSSMF